jgi:hypothetical protein
MAIATPAAAQDRTASPWAWSADANVIVGYNYQQRLFADFSAWESQNWFMGRGERRFGSGRLSIGSMLSLEPFTVPAGGSPQLFQTGETYRDVPLVNHQHPHDLIMELGATFRLAQRGVTWSVGADLVGSPTLGPPPFMHRESARDNPQVPITHHFMDSTHITTGVVRGAIATGPFAVEASIFRGAEPDENRTNIERPALDSWAARLRWQRGSWSAQFSGGRLKAPEWFEPYDETRLTASIAYEGHVRSRPFNVLFAWGQNRESVVANGVADGFLLEWNLGASSRWSVYGRSEIGEKQLFGLGFHPRGFEHPHVYSHLDTLTVGAIRDLWHAPRSRIGLGADVTLYHMSPDLLPYFTGSHSYHVFVRWRPVGPAAPHHVH